MDQYFCDCGNVLINITEGRSINATDFLRSEEIPCVDRYFSDQLLDVELAISGIEVAQETLLRERQYGDWLIYKCINCCKDSHSIHSIKGTERVLVPSNLMHGSGSLQKIKDSKSYSKVFNIDLKDFKRKGNVPCLKSRNVSEISAKLNKNANKFLKLEEDAMNERIRLFTEEQRMQFQDLKLKTGQQKDWLLKKIRQYEGNQMESLFDSFNESYFGSTTKSEERDLSTDLPQIKGVAARNIPIKQSLSANLAQSLPSNISPNKSSKGRRRGNITFSTNRHRAYSESDDTMFDLEDFQENRNCEPFYESDDDSGDTTSLESSGGGYTMPSSRGLNPGDRVYATSVPVSIPLFENTKNSYDLESDEDQTNSPSPNHIADSIKALAKSMQDSTGMFGELPRPRLNTFK